MSKYLGKRPSLRPRIPTSALARLWILVALAFVSTIYPDPILLNGKPGDPGRGRGRLREGRRSGR